MHRLPFVLACLTLVAAMAVVACGQPPERTVAVTPSLDLPESLPVGQPMEIEYVWTPAEEFTSPADDYKVFVHITDPDGRIIVQDDHYPPTPTSQWTSGEAVSYSRWVYPPTHVRPDYLDFHVGLYLEQAVQSEGGGRAAVLVDGDWEDRPRVHRLYVRSEDIAGLPVPFEGWYEEERDLENPEHRWMWMKRHGVVAFGNPHGPAVLHLKAHSPVDEIGGEPQAVKISVDGQELTTFEVTDSTPFLRRFEVPASMMPEGDWVEVAIEVDRWFVPASFDPSSTDTRELGLQVQEIYLAAQGS